MTSLRERNRRSAVEHIQAVAFKLFTERGYRDVTITEIAREAQIAPSTFYRLFQTKEGLFTALPAEGTLDLSSVRLDHLAEDLEHLIEDNQWRGLQWVIEEPEVRRAVMATLDQLSTELIEVLVTQGSERMDAAVRVRKLVFGVYLTSLEQWYHAGRSSPFVTYFRNALVSEKL